MRVSCAQGWRRQVATRLAKIGLNWCWSLVEGLLDEVSAWANERGRENRESYVRREKV